MPHAPPSPDPALRAPVSWTPEQEAVFAHPLDAHAVVRAAPGAGKTTTLVERVRRLLARGVAPHHVRVVMFNRSVQAAFAERLGEGGVKVSTFDALGLEVLRAAERRRLLSKPLQVVADLRFRLGREVFLRHRDDFDDAEEIERAVAFWKAHMVPPSRAAFPSNPVLVDAYREWEEGRQQGETLRIGYEDMVYTAVAVSRRTPGLLGRIDHLLVDEFQDVNPARVELVNLLIQRETAVMVVGDEDQGINEWAGAHPRFFRDFPQTFPNLPTKSYRLSRSFRFGPNLAKAATRMIQHNQERGPGVVEGAGSRGTIRHVREVGPEVKKLLERGVPARDVAVLYRGRNQSAVVIAALVADGIPIHTDDIGLLRNGRGPELALQYLQHAVGSGPVTMEDVWPVVFAPDRYIQKEAFSKQVRQLGGKGLKAVLKDRGLATSLGQGRGAVAAMATLGRLLEKMGRCATASEALDLLVEEVDVEEQIRGRLRSEVQQESAIACFHAVHAFFSGVEVPPAGAAAALQAIDARRGLPEADCVWVSTIHKAKGLEWPHVFLPGLLEGACPAEQRGKVAGTKEEPGGIAQSPWIEQERRIFFVGLTRAMDTVYLHAPEEAPSRFVEELAEPKPKAATPPRPRRDMVTGMFPDEEEDFPGWGAGSRGAGTWEVGMAGGRVGGERGRAERGRAEPGTPQRSAPAKALSTRQVVEAMAPSSGIPWTAAGDERLLAGWRAGDGLQVLAVRLGRSAAAVAKRLVKLGVVGTRDEAMARM